MKVSPRRSVGGSGRFQINELVNQAPDFVAAERCDDALDLPPVAEARDIALVAAALGAGRRLVAGVVAEAIHQLRGVGQGETSMNEGRVHRDASNPEPVEVVPTNVVNASLTMFPARGHGPPMRNNTRAGGCLLTICILAGFPLGLSLGDPMKGILIGTATGAALALALWLIDRRKQR